MRMRLLVSLPLLVLAFAFVGCKKDPAQAQGGADPSRKIKITEVEPGDGAVVELRDLAIIEYSGRLAETQAEFDSNEGKDLNGDGTKPPLSNVVGSGSMIAGFDQALVGMKKGGVRKVFIPWELGYGEEGSSQAGIPARADLEFTIKILDIVKSTESSVYSAEDEVVGTGREVKEGDEVTLHYRGTYANGMQFDNSRQRGDEEAGGTPVTFVVGEKRAIPGIDDGVRGMKVGGIRNIVMPPALAFGNQTNNNIQGNQVLHFRIELLSIK